MNGHFDLAALGMLVAVAETGGFTAASARLGRTQSAVSVRIQDLKGQTMERNPRPVDVTVVRQLGETVAGTDSQLDAAVKVLLGQ